MAAPHHRSVAARLAGVGAHRGELTGNMSRRGGTRRHGAGRHRGDDHERGSRRGADGMHVPNAGGVPPCLGHAVRERPHEGSTVHAPVARHHDVDERTDPNRAPAHHCDRTLGQLIEPGFILAPSVWRRWCTRELGALASAPGGIMDALAIDAPVGDGIEQPAQVRIETIRVQHEIYPRRDEIAGCHGPTHAALE